MSAIRGLHHKFRNLFLIKQNFSRLNSECGQGADEFKECAESFFHSQFSAFRFPFSVFSFNPVVQVFLPCGSEKCK